MRVSSLLLLVAAFTGPVSSSCRAGEPLRVVYLGTPGSARAAAFRTFLEERFSEVVVGDRRTLRSTARAHGDVHAIVLDGAPDEGLPFLPIRTFDAGFGAIATPPLVLVGGTGRAVANAHGLMGADGRRDVDLDAVVRPHPFVHPSEEAAVLRVASSGERFGAHLGSLEGEPFLELLVVSSGVDGDALPVVFRQGNVLHFGFDADPDALTAAGRDLLAASIGYAARFRDYHHAAQPFEPARPTPSGDLARLDVDPTAPSFPREVVRRATESAAPGDRTAARRLLARYLPDGPSPFAHPSRWDEWLERYAASLAFSRWRGDRWVVDALALRRRVPSAALRGSARVSEELELRAMPWGTATDDDLRRAVDQLFAGSPIQEEDDAAAATIQRCPDRAALELARRLRTETEPDARRRLVRLLGTCGRDAVHGFAALREALGSHDLALRRAAAATLGEMGGAAVLALEETLLVDEDATVRRRAASALFVTGHEATPVAPALASALVDPDDGVRTYAALALLRCHDLDDTTLAALGEAAADPDETVRFWARAAITRHRPRRPSARVERRADPRTEAARTFAIAMLTIDDPERRAEAAFALSRGGDVDALDDETRGRVDAALDEWVAAQVESTDDDFMEMGTGSVHVLRNVDLSLPGMAADLLRYPRFPVGPVSFQPFLPILRRAGADAIPTLALCLDHWYMGSDIGLEGLSHLGREVRFAFPALVAHWSRGIDWPGDEAFLRQPGPWSEDHTDHHVLLATELVPELLAAREHDSDVVRRAAAALLRTVNPLLLESEAALVARLTTDETDPIGVVDALARRPLDVASRDALVRFLGARDRPELQVVASLAAASLDDWTPPDPATAAAAVRSTDPRVVVAALHYLERLGPAAVSAVPSLRDTLTARAGGLDGGRAELFRIKGLPRALAAAGPPGLEALAAVYPSFLADGSGLRRTDAGRYGPREPCVEIEVALLTAGAPAEAALRDVLSGPTAPAGEVRAELEWFLELFRAEP